MSSLIYGQGFILLMYQVYAITFPWVVYSIKHGTRIILLTSTVELLPYLAFSVMGGALADRIDRKRLLVYLNIACFVPLGVLFIWVSTPRWTWVIPLGGLAIGSVMATLLPTTESIFPHLVEPSQLLKMNARWEVVNYTAALLGPILGSIIWALGRFRLILLFLAMLVAISVIIRVLWHHPPFPLQTSARAPSIIDYLSLAVRLGKHPTLRWGIFYSWITNCLMAPVSSLLIILLRIRLHLPLTEIAPWLALANVIPWLLNQALGRLSSTTSWSDRAVIRLLGLSILAQGMGMGVISLSVHSWEAFLGLAINLGGVALYTTHWRLLRQRVTPKSWIGRVSGLSRSLAYSGYIIGGIVGLFVLPYVRLPQLTLFCSTGVVGVALVTLIILQGWGRIRLPGQDDIKWIDS